MTQHPLSETFSRLTHLSEYINAQVGLSTEADWVEPRLLFAASSAHLQDRNSYYQSNLHTTSKNMIGSAVLQAYQWQFIASAIGSYLIDRRVLDLSHHNVQVKLDEKHVEVETIAFASGHFYALPADPAATHPDASIISNPAALRDQLRQELETHFGWLIEQIDQAIGAKPRGLWLDVADRCAGTLIWLMREIDPAIEPTVLQQEIDQLIRVPNSPLNYPKIGIFTLTCGDETRAFLDRASCCYWYRTEDAEGKLCTTCPRRPDEERNKLLLDYMAKEQAKKAQQTVEASFQTVVLEE